MPTITITHEIVAKCLVMDKDTTRKVEKTKDLTQVVIPLCMCPIERALLEQHLISASVLYSGIYLGNAFDELNVYQITPQIRRVMNAYDNYNSDLHRADELGVRPKNLSLGLELPLTLEIKKVQK